MPINYISSVASIRYNQLMRLQELLRLEFNKKGELFRNGQLSKQDYLHYVKNEYDKKDNLIIHELLIYKKLIKEDNTMNTNLSDVII